MNRKINGRDFVMESPSGSAFSMAHEHFAAHPIQQYKPSLSYAVYDTVFSYWLLPHHVKKGIQTHTPKIGLLYTSNQLSMDFEWSKLDEFFNIPLQTCPEVNSIEKTWSFALEIEKTFASNGFELFKIEWDAATGACFTHGLQLNRLIRLYECEGSFYLAFLTLITVLERALYDLHHQETSKLAASDSKKPVSTPPTAPIRKKNMILRDLLQSPSLTRVLPPGYLHLLHRLFFPSGLNLRNLVWHWFISPFDVPKCFCTLVLVLLLELPRHLLSHNREPEPLFHPQHYDSRFELASSLRLQLLQNPSEMIHEAYQILKMSQFIPRGRLGLLFRALTSLITQEDELLFLFCVVPVLEHALRLLFVKLHVSSSPELALSFDKLALAQKDEYYSTMDGFGQRSKHQVLLHPTVLLLSTNGNGSLPLLTNQNQLYTNLPTAALHVLLDLFMMATGPNLRAKLCHGETDLSSSLSSTNQASSSSISSRLLLWTLLSLAAQYTETKSKRIQVFESGYRSSFHPTFMLLRTLRQVYSVSRQCGQVFSHHRYTLHRLAEKEEKESQWLVTFPRLPFVESDQDQKQKEPVSIVEKQSKLVDWGFLRLSAAAPKTTKNNKGFLFLTNQIEAKITQLIQTLQKHYKNDHDRETSGFLHLLQVYPLDLSLPGIVESQNTPSHTPHWLVEENISLETTETDDNNATVACLLETITSSQRSLLAFQERLHSLFVLIRKGDARTAQRRGFLSAVAMLPVLYKVELLVLSCLEHQLVCRMEQKGKCTKGKAYDNLGPKLLALVTSVEGVTGSIWAAQQKSFDKGLLVIDTFLNSNAVRQLE